MRIFNKQALLQFLTEVFGESIFDPIYKALAGAGAIVLLFKIIVSVIELFSDITVPEILAGPVFWQIFISFLILLSHGQKIDATMDRDVNIFRYWLFRIIELLAVITSFGAVGLIVVYVADLLPFAFFGLAVMLVAIIVRRWLTDSINAWLQVLRFFAVIGFIYIGYVVNSGGDANSGYIYLISIILLLFYIFLIYIRIVQDRQEAKAKKG